ncbi:type II and III secretion system protein, partial [Nostoc linckia z15]
MVKKLFFFFLITFLPASLHAQQDMEALSLKLDEFSAQKPGLKEVLKIDVSGLTVHDFITTIAGEYQLNVSVDADLNQAVTNNFYDVTVKDVFLFLADRYDLDISFMSNIILFKKHKEQKVIEKRVSKIADVYYNPQNDFLSVKLQNDSLSSVAKTITDRSGKNVLIAQDVKGNLITSYILNRPFDQVIEMMAKSNDLNATKDENGIYFISKGLPAAVTEKTTGRSR